ncbi:hypothetical protein [Streptomyces sp. NPDC005438]|uniref:hypothetical protein n=1 Tax=Streptomyces sp. NPDC005438 TaxID=3156880 RepID=UPI0033B4886B
MSTDAERSSSNRPSDTSGQPPRAPFGGRMTDSGGRRPDEDEDSRPGTPTPRTRRSGRPPLSSLLRPQDDTEGSARPARPAPEDRRPPPPPSRVPHQPPPPTGRPLSARPARPKSPSSGGTSQPGTPRPDRGTEPPEGRPTGETARPAGSAGAPGTPRPRREAGPPPPEGPPVGGPRVRRAEEIPRAARPAPTRRPPEAGRPSSTGLRDTGRPAPSAPRSGVPSPPAPPQAPPPTGRPLSGRSGTTAATSPPTAPPSRTPPPRPATAPTPVGGAPRSPRTEGRTASPDAGAAVPGARTRQDEPAARTAPTPVRPDHPPRPGVPPLPPRPPSGDRDRRRDLGGLLSGLRRTPPRTVAAGVCFVLGVGLLGGSLAGRLLSGDDGDPKPADTYERARDLWRETPVDQLFPQRSRGPNAGPGGAERRWTRVAVAPDGGCARALDPGLAKALSSAGCHRLVRATYVDETSSSVTTVGLLFTDADRKGMARLRARFAQGNLSERTDLMPRPYAARGTPAADFGDAQRASWSVRVLVDQPVVVYTVTGFADGRVVSAPQSAEEATGDKAVTAPAQAGLGHDAQGLADLAERRLESAAKEHRAGEGE